jgi:tRNA-dihydrouridine synthase
MDTTGCDGIMICREAHYNPWFFRDAVDFAAGKSTNNPDEVSEEETPSVSDIHKAREIRDLMLFQLEELVSCYGEIGGVKKMRKFAAWYTRGIRGSARFRENVNRHETHGGMKTVIEEYFRYCGV